jgi:hypothetical protein
MLHGQSIAFRQIMGAERTLASVLCQVLRSDETVTCSPSEQHSDPAGLADSDRHTAGTAQPKATCNLARSHPLGGWLPDLVSRAIGAVQLNCTRLVLL